ncbi:uncharacterized protein TRUGW13939_11789 [Talaromyces rugulosus]|uniref:Uncharacterized protein n=1 Tax=Talaromyces rugulosus TaxID=121627 RepID=A0A7H8RE07_TALRU|nr:uncharacterized protein TRUGW13939_11789 [Talaromyces rugulosus]QKX64614.1 hypothetical protein TRUGW13939_11789 [Talaromyces rugulosus]
MARKSPQKPAAAYVEEYDDDAGSVIPHTRQSANIAAKRSKSDFGPLELVPIDFASDSGYSSRTAATGNSSQSRASGKPSPLALSLDTNPRSKTADAVRTKESRRDRDKGKQRDEKRASADMMYMNPRTVAPHQRSPSKSRRRESVTMQHQPPEGYWPYGNNGYPPAAMPAYPVPTVDPRPMDYHHYYSQPPPQANEIPPPSPQASRYPYPSYGPEMHVAQSPIRQRRPSRVSAYHLDERPLSYHAGMPENMYNPGALPASSPFEHYGPPPATSAYYTQPSTPQHQYFGEPASPYDTVYEKSRTSSASRPREQRRRSSVYTRPVIEQPTPKASYEDGGYLERHVSREHRSSRRQSESRRPESRRPVEIDGLDEDYYRMPPPPPPVPKPKAKIIQKRPEHPPKSMTTGSVPPTGRRMSHSRDSWDLSELKEALPHQQLRKIVGGPERSQSMKAPRRMSYNTPDGARRIAIEDSRRRRTLYYDDEPEPRPDSTVDMEQQHRNAEEYQAAKSGRTGVPLTADALKLKTRIAQQRQESDSGSQKSRSNSSRGSDARTRDGSGVGSQFESDNTISMNLGGMSISFNPDTVSGKTIHMRADDDGAFGLNIEDRRPKKYIMPAGSEFTAPISRREIEDGRRAREDKRSDRASRLSSRSTFSSR